MEVCLVVFILCKIIFFEKKMSQAQNERKTIHVKKVVLIAIFIFFYFFFVLLFFAFYYKKKKRWTTNIYKKKIKILRV